MFKKRPRLDWRCYLGEQRYFLTFCVDERRSVFTDAHTVAQAWQQILHAAAKHSFSIIAYVFMPDHVHLLIEGLDAGSDMCAFAHSAKQKTAYQYTHATQRRLWQPSFWDHVLRDEESTWDVAYYVVANPIRKGLVQRWEAYPFWGSGTMSREELIQELMAHPPKAWQP